MKHNKCLCCVHQCLDATPLIPTSVRGKLPKDHSAAHLATSDSTPRSASLLVVCGNGIAGPGEEEAMKRTTDDGDAESATLRSRDCGGVASSSSTPGLGQAGAGRRCLNNQCMVPPEDGSSGYCRQCLSQVDAEVGTTLPTPTPSSNQISKPIIHPEHP